MKQFISLLVAALFAAASVTAVAQDKKMDKSDKKMEKSGQMDKKEAPKKEATAAQKKQQERMKACNEQANDRNLKSDDRKKFVNSCLKGDAKKAAKKADGKKKDEMKK